MSAPSNTSGESSANTMPPAIKYGIAAIFAIVGISGSVKLMVSESSSSSIIILVSVSFFSLLLIFFGDQVDWFDLKNLKVKMRKIEAARKEVEEREKEVRRVALAISEITVFLAAFHRRLGSDETHELEVEWLKKKVRQLLTESSASVDEQSRAFRFLREIEEMDRIKETDQKASEVRWNAIWAMIKDEIQKG